jgi:hypothetical protein
MSSLKRSLVYCQSKMLLVEVLIRLLVDARLLNRVQRADIGDKGVYNIYNITGAVAGAKTSMTRTRGITAIANTGDTKTLTPNKLKFLCI